MSGGRSRLAATALVALSFVGLSFAACTEADEALLAALGGGCLLDSDCEGDLVCVFQRCHQACETSADCPAGQRCVLGSPPTHVCLLDDETECVRTSDCPETLICGTDLQCRDECIADPDCLSDQICSRQTCALESELVDGTLPVNSSDGEVPCVFDSECPVPQRCVDNVCRFDCVVDADCPSESCVDNVCDPVGPLAPTCVPGLQVSCPCPTGGDGVQICQQDGMGFGDCLGCAGMGMAGPCSPTMGEADPSYQWDQAFTFPAPALGLRGLALGPNGEIVLGGVASSATGPVDLGGQVYTAADGADAFVARYASDGSVQTVLGIDPGVGSAQASAIVITPTGDVWVAGDYGGPSATAPDVGLGPMAPPPAMFLIRMNSAGTVLSSDSWTFTPQVAPSGAFVQNITLGASGAVALGGSYYGTVNFGSGPISSPTNNDYATFLALFDNTGTNVWTRTFGSAGGNGLSAVRLALNPADELFLASSFFGITDLGLGALPAVDTVDYVLGGFSATGTTLFQAAYDGTGPMDALKFGNPVASGNDFVIAGSYEAVAPPDLGGGPLAMGSSGNNLFELTMSANGTWVADLVTPNASLGINGGVFLDSQGNRLLTGVLDQAPSFGPCMFGAATSDTFIARRSPMGTLDWVRRFPTPPDFNKFSVNANGDLLAMFFNVGGNVITTDLGGGPLMGNHFLTRLTPVLP